MKDNNSHQKIEDALSSLEGIERAEADPSLYDSILQRIDARKTKIQKIIPMRTVWLAAASFVFMTLLNVVSLIHKSKKQQNALAKHGVTEGGYSAASAAIAHIYLNQNAQ